MGVSRSLQCNLILSLAEDLKTYDASAHPEHVGWVADSQTSESYQSRAEEYTAWNTASKYVEYWSAVFETLKASIPNLERRKVHVQQKQYQAQEQRSTQKWVSQFMCQHATDRSKAEEQQDKEPKKSHTHVISTDAMADLLDFVQVLRWVLVGHIVWADVKLEIGAEILKVVIVRQLCRTHIEQNTQYRN